MFLSFPRVLRRRCCFLAIIVVMFAAIVSSPAQTAARSAKSEIPGSEKINLYRRGSWEFSLESAYTFDVVSNPFHSIVDGRIQEPNPINYNLVTQLLAVRYRLTSAGGPSFLRGSFEASATLVGSVIVRGPESYFAGLAFGLRYDFVQPGARLVPYIEMRGGPGATDSQGLPETQQQDLMFTYLLSAGLRYDCNSRWSVTVGALDQHVSNGYLAKENFGCRQPWHQLGSVRSFLAARRLHLKLSHFMVGKWRRRHLVQDVSGEWRKHFARSTGSLPRRSVMPADGRRIQPMKMFAATRPDMPKSWRSEFDPAMVSYSDLLDVFWSNHNPTTLNRQGPDVGDQYRSVIFYHSPEQRAAAEASKAELDKSGRFRRSIVTQIEPAPKFYRAEEYHQRYLEKRGLSHCAI